SARGAERESTWLRRGAVQVLHIQGGVSVGALLLVLQLLDSLQIRRGEIHCRSSQEAPGLHPVARVAGAAGAKDTGHCGGACQGGDLTEALVLAPVGVVGK